VQNKGEVYRIILALQPCELPSFIAKPWFYF